MLGFKGEVHPEIKVLSLFIHPHVVSKLYDFISDVEMFCSRSKLFFSKTTTASMYYLFDYGDHKRRKLVCSAMI